MPSSSQHLITIFIIVLHNVDLPFASYQPYNYGFPRQPRFPIRSHLRRPYGQQSLPRPIYTQTGPPTNGAYYNTPMPVITTEKISTTTAKTTTAATTQKTTTAATTQKTTSMTTIKLQLKLSKEAISTMLSSIEKDGTLKEFGVSSHKMKKILNDMWPAYKKAQSHVLEKEKARLEMLKLKKMYLAKKKEVQKWNRYKLNKANV